MAICELETGAPHSVYALTGVATRRGLGLAGIAVIVKDRQKNTLKHIRGRIHTTSPDAPKYQAVIRALREGLALGAHSITVYSDDPIVVGHLSRDLEVPPELHAAYMEARALMHRYRRAQVRFLEEARNRKARTLAELVLTENGQGTRDYRSPGLPLMFTEPAEANAR